MRSHRAVPTALGIVLVAASLPMVAIAGPCESDTMANYLKLDKNGCTVEDKIFRKYFYDSTVSVNGMVLTDPITGKPQLLPDPTVVQVAPIKAPNPPPFSFNPGLEFSSVGWTVGPNQTISSTIDYIVEVPKGSPLIKDASLLLRGTAVNGGSILDQETVFSTLLTPKSNILTAFCDGSKGAPCVAPGDPALPQPMLFKDVQFDRSVDLVEVHNVLTISCGANINCMASVSGLENRFSEIEPPSSQVPGPTPLWLLALSLTLLFARLVGRVAWRRSGGRKFVAESCTAAGLLD